MNNTPIEHERKYLIRYPDRAKLLQMEGVTVWNVIQTYLEAEEGVSRRVRHVKEDGKNIYYLTEKRRISNSSSFEDEKEITREEYAEYLTTAQKGAVPVRKTRYRVPYGEYLAEIDVYPFWEDRAILEIEQPEGADVPFPPFAEMIKEVTDDKRYKNARLAYEVPKDEI